MSVYRMMEYYLVLFLLVYGFGMYNLVEHVRDALEFTCIDYDEFLMDDTPKRTIVVKYEDKYKQGVLAMPNEYVIDEAQTTDKYNILLKDSIREIADKINRELIAYESELNQEKETDLVEQRINFISEKMEQMKMELWAKVLIKDEIKELAVSQLIQEKLDKLIISFVMEHTPLGNVIMYYNNKNETFEYYSDAVIPYRYLETVCRKYVIANVCRPLYIDMEEELLECQKTEPTPAPIVQKEVSMPKKNVFAKLKNYNTATPSNTKTRIKTKTNMNKFLYQGRMNNFSFMKQTEKTQVFSYADYKQMMNK